MSAIFAGERISHVTRVVFDGSSNPIERTFPRAKGLLILPSNKVERYIELNCSWHISEKSKTQIERYQHNLVEAIAASEKGDLLINGNTYTNVLPITVTGEVDDKNEFFIYTVRFRLDHTQDFMDSQVNSAQVRPGYFTYKYGDKDQEFSEFGFNFYNNWEAGFSGRYESRELARKIRANDTEYEFNSGVEEINLNCWLVATPTQHIESYLFNFLCGPGPLGKQGTINLNGQTYEKAIMSSLNHDIIKSNTGSAGTGESSVRYSLNFLVSIQC